VIQPTEKPAVPTPSPPDTVASQNSTQQSPSIGTMAAVPEVQTPAPTQAPSTSAAVQPVTPVVDSAAVAQAALEKQRHDEQGKIAEEKQNTVDQFSRTLADRMAEFAKIKSGYESRLDDNTNKIAKLPNRYRSSFLRQNDQARDLIERSLQKQQKALNIMQGAVQSFSHDGHVDSNKVANVFDFYSTHVPEMRSNSEAILGKMDEVLSNAAAR
jgi:flagellar biosynthesis/type III secretory pathway chaperone